MNTLLHTNWLSLNQNTWYSHSEGSCVITLADHADFVSLCFMSYIQLSICYNGNWTAFLQPDVMTVWCKELCYFLYHIHELHKEERSKEPRYSLYSVHIYVHQ